MSLALIQHTPQNFRGHFRAPTAKPVAVGLAKEIMGSNFIPLIKGFDSQDEIRNVSTTVVTSRGRSVTEAELERSARTHVLIYVPASSIVELENRVALVYRTPIFHQDDWWKGEGFAKVSGLPGYHLIRKNLLAPGFSPNWDYQKGKLGSDEELVTTRVMSHFIVRYFLATALRLFPDRFARCGDSGREGRGKVGYFCREGIQFARGSVKNSTTNGQIGLASEKKQ